MEITAFVLIDHHLIPLSNNFRFFFMKLDYFEPQTVLPTELPS